MSDSGSDQIEDIALPEEGEETNHFPSYVPKTRAKQLATIQGTIEKDIKM